MQPAKRPSVSKIGQSSSAVRPKIVQSSEASGKAKVGVSSTVRKAEEKPEMAPAGLRRLPAKPARKTDVEDEEEKANEKPSLKGPYTEKPSARFRNIKTVDVFSTKPAQKT